MTRQKITKLAIIGAGPKAIAIAAKAKILSLLGFQTPHIILFEKHRVGHNWTRFSGLTNGDLLLGTSPDKDIGFPYYSFCWGDTVNGLVNRLMKCLSWQTFLISNHRFAEWVDRGRVAPNHRLWAEYLAWVFAHIKNDIIFINEEAVSIDVLSGQWLIHSTDSAGVTRVTAVDGLVTTGPGATHLPFPMPVHPHILKTENFWLTQGDYRNLRNKAIALIGSGENAATVAVNLGSIHPSNRIDIISPSAMNYTRGESYVENHLYTDPFQGNWHLFTKADRKNFIARTDRGVFSVDTKKALDLLPNVEVIPGECKKIIVDSMQQIILDVQYNKLQEDRIYDMVVVTTGFDHAGFLLGLLSEAAKAYILENAKLSSLSRDDLQDAISETLAIENLTPALHLPMLAGLRQGPGFPNLSSLGRLSDHILSHHVLLEERQAIDHEGIFRLVTKVETLKHDAL